MMRMPYHRPYDETRVEEIRLRQTFVLDCLAESGTVIETCPTSNLRIGAVPSEAAHPVHNFRLGRPSNRWCR